MTGAEAVIGGCGLLRQAWDTMMLEVMMALTEREAVVLGLPPLRKLSRWLDSGSKECAQGSMSSGSPTPER